MKVGKQHNIMADIKFGTDGWRAIIAEDFTFANVARVAQATADYWRINPPAGTSTRVIIGFDRRFLSDRFARLAAEVLAANGFHVVLTPEPTSTPAVSLAVHTQHAAGGIMITASHNPPIFNGFKLKAHFGGSADESLCHGVEQLLDANPVQRIPLEQGVAQRRIQVRSLRASHLAAIKRLVDFPRISRSKVRFAHDALFGVGAGCFDELLAGTGCHITTLNGEHNPLFGGLNPEPVPQNYARSAAYLRRHPHDLCLVTDGDADRVGGMDGRGRPLSTHQLICLLLHHFVANRHQTGRVIKALTTTSMVDRMCAEHGLDLVETPVGFKYVCHEMRKGNVLLGFEESGGIGFPGHIPERDGLLAGLMLLELLATEQTGVNRLIARLERRYGTHRYARHDISFPLEKRPNLMDYCARQPPNRLLRSPVVEVKTFDGVKYVAANGSWLMLRGSGTEPVLRIYAEADSDAGARRLLRLGQRLTRQV
jgi:phosphomannomutase